MARTVPEWIAKHDDEAIPPRVKLRILDRYRDADGFVVCQVTGIPIQPGDQVDFDHEIALINGGQHRESNLRPVLRYSGHVMKTAADMRVKSKIARVRKKHMGVAGKKAVIPGSRGTRWKKKITGEVVPR